MLDFLFGPPGSLRRADEAATPPSWGRQWPSGRYRTKSNVVVDEDLALTYAAVWCASRILMEGVASLPLKMYRRTKAGHEEFPDDPRYHLVGTAPNPKMGSFAFREGRTLHQVNYGNGFAEIERDADDFPVNLWPIHPGRIRPVRPYDNVPGYDYVVRNNDGSGVAMRASEILHVPGAGSEDGVWGKGVVTQARESIGMGLATEAHGGAYFGGGAQPRAVITGPGMKDKDQRANFRSEWKEIHGSPDSGEIAILPMEAKYQAITLSNEDSQFLECLAPETLVTLADGTLRRADELTIKDSVWGWDQAAGKLAPSRIECIADNGVHPRLKITTHRGRELITTKNHPYLASKRPRCEKCNRRHGPLEHGLESRWILAHELDVGDYVRVGLRFGAADPLPMDPEEAWYVGAMTGDGYCRGKKSVGFSNADAGVIQKMHAFAARRGMGMRQKVSNPVDWYFVGREVGVEEKPSIARTILAPYGVLGKKAHQKTVPEPIERAATEAKAAFLGGLWDADGSVSGPQAKQPRIALGNTSRSLLDRTQHLLASLGIQSAIYLQREAGERDVNGRMCRTRDCWQLVVCGKSEAREFARLVGPHIGHEEKRRRLVAFLAQEPGAREHRDFFEFDRIVKVEELPPDSTVALTVAVTHSHVTNGIVTHNTRKHNVTEIARWYRLPPHMLADLERATFSNIEQQGIEFVQNSLWPWLCRWCEQLSLKLLTPRERLELFFAFDLTSLLRGDFKTRMEGNVVALLNGQKTLNDIMKSEGWNTIGPEGDVRFMPLNIGTLDRVIAGPPEPAVAADPDKPDVGGGGDPAGDAPPPDPGEDPAEKPEPTGEPTNPSAFAPANRLTESNGHV